MSDVPQEMSDQVQTITQQLTEGTIIRDEARALLMKLKNTVIDPNDAGNRAAIRYIFTTLKTLGR